MDVEVPPNFLNADPCFMESDPPTFGGEKGVRVSASGGLRMVCAAGDKPNERARLTLPTLTSGKAGFLGAIELSSLPIGFYGWSGACRQGIRLKTLAATSY